MPIRSPISTYSSLWELDQAALPVGSCWRLLLSDGTLWCCGTTDSDGELNPHPLSVTRAGAYFPWSEFAIGTNAAGEWEVISGSGFSVDGSGFLDIDTDPVTDTAGVIRSPFTFKRPYIMEAQTSYAFTGSSAQHMMELTRQLDTTDSHGMLWTENAANTQLYSIRKTNGSPAFSAAADVSAYDGGDMAARMVALPDSVYWQVMSSGAEYGTTTPATAGGLLNTNNGMDMGTAGDVFFLDFRHANATGTATLTVKGIRIVEERA